MSRRKGNKPTNGKGSEFDTDADFIPFELSAEDESNGSENVSQTPDGMSDSRVQQLSANAIRKSTDREGRKRKRSEIDSRSGIPQRQKFANSTINPWQTDSNGYGSYRETSRM